jgi:hypothetical protein
MPGMPRIDKKTAEIAYKIVGVPANLRSKESQKQEKQNKRLTYEETQRVR